MKQVSSWQALLGAAACLGGMACSAEGADTDTLGSTTQPLDPGTYVLLSQSAGGFVAVEGNAVGNGVDVIIDAGGSGSIPTAWQFKLTGNGNFRLQAEHSGKCLRARGDTEVVQGACRYQRTKWQVVEEPSSPGTIQLVSQKNGNCVTAGASVVQAPCVTYPEPDPDQWFTAAQWQ